MVYILILNNLLTELKGKKYSLSESFQEAITNVFIWHLNIFGSKWQGHGLHQFSNLAFSITSAANKDVKYWSYIGEGCSNFSQIPVWWFIKSLEIKITCQCQKVEWPWVQRRWESKPRAQLNLCSTTPAKKHGHCSPSTLSVGAEFTLEREEDKATQLFFSGFCMLQTWFLIKNPSLWPQFNLLNPRTKCHAITLKGIQSYLFTLRTNSQIK